MKPLAVSMGDPAGIGLEIAARVWADKQGAPDFFLVGDPDAFARAAARLGAPAPELIVAETPEALRFEPGALSVLHAPLAIEETPGAPDPVNASAVINAIKQGADAVRAGASAL